MLKILRKKKTMKAILWVLAAIIVPAFVLWGAGEGARSRRKGPSYVGTIYGRKVSFKKYADSYEACFHQLILASGGNAERFKAMKESININQMAWERLVMLETAKRDRIAVTNQEIVAAISSNPLFIRENGFSKDVYDHVLQYMLRAAPRTYEEETRQNLAIGKLRDKITAVVAVTEDEVRQAYHDEHDMITISYLLVDPENFKEAIESNDEQLNAFYEEKKELFRKGDEVNILYFTIAADDEDLLRKVDEDNKSNKRFEAIAADHNIAIKETGFFGMNETIPQIGWNFELAKAAFSLETGMVSLPIFAADTYYVITVKEKRSGYLPPLAEIREKLEKEFIKQQATASAQASAASLYGKIEKLMEEGKDFGKAAAAADHTVVQSKPFSRGQYVEGLGQARELKDLAFASSPGTLEAPVQCEKGFVLFTVDEYTAAAEEKFDEEKEGLREQLVTQKKNARLREWFENVMKNAQLAIDLAVLPD